MSVYFARVRGYVKIGYSKNPLTRCDTLTRGAGIRPADIERDDNVDLLGWFPGDRAVERSAHAALGSHHVCGEWFKDAPEVEAYLLGQDGFDDGLRYVPPSTLDDPEFVEFAQRIIAGIYERRAKEREFWRNQGVAA